MQRWMVLGIALAGCLHSSSETCPSGRVCPEHTECIVIEAVEVCATDAQKQACDGLAELALCNPEDDRFHCLAGLCLDACGNSQIDPGETCDDGNRLDGDGCSARCLDEACGNGVIDEAKGEQCDDGVAHVSGDGCSSNCQLEAAQWVDISPVPITARAGFRVVRDTRRDRMIAFGGLGPTENLGDTWELKPSNDPSATWRKLETARSPSPRQEYSMVYDSFRDRVVLFGGYGPDGLSDETWEFDGLSWARRTPAVSPPHRKEAGMAYDPARKVAVLFGGNHIDGLYSDTWEWDGTSWVQKQPATSPPAASHGAMVFNVANQQILQFSYTGTQTEIWLWNGTTWTSLGATTLPNQNAFIEAAYDDVRQRTIVTFVATQTVNEWTGSAWQSLTTTGVSATRAYYGFAYDGAGIMLLAGSSATSLGNSNGMLYSDRWRWTGGPNWNTLSSNAAVPPKRPFATAVYDQLTAQMLIGGGISALGNQTWSWSASGWNLVDISAPQATYRPGAYDSTRGRSVVFGGFRNSTTNLDETWEISSAGKWTQVSPATRPPARGISAMAYDAARGAMILFGGASADNSTTFGDTWSFDGTTWTQLFPATSPPARSGHVMAYDPVRERIVLFGGSATIQSQLGDTWEWDGTTWIEMHPTHPPGARTDAAMTYDPLRRRIVLVGGLGDYVNWATYSDRAEWDGNDWITRTDTLLARSQHFMSFDQVRGGLIVFGGTISEYGGGPLDETWLLRYSSLEPRETCLLASDDLDGDGLAGCADPDCWGRCAPACPPGVTCPASAPHCGDGTCSAPLEDSLICPGDCMP